MAWGIVLAAGAFDVFPKPTSRHVEDSMNYMAFDSTQDGHGGRGEEHRAEMEQVALTVYARERAKDMEQIERMV